MREQDHDLWVFVSDTGERGEDPFVGPIVELYEIHNVFAHGLAPTRSDDSDRRAGFGPVEPRGYNALPGKKLATGQTLVRPSRCTRDNLYSGAGYIILPASGN